MDNKPQTVDGATQTRDTSTREPADPDAPRRAAGAAVRESRVSDPPVGTDGQMIEAGYGHGV